MFNAMPFKYSAKQSNQGKILFLLQEDFMIKTISLAYRKTGLTRSNIISTGWRSTAPGR